MWGYPLRKEWCEGDSVDLTDDDLDMAPIGPLLRYFRKRADWSQRALADAAGLSDGLIGNVERGTRNLGVETVEAVAEALHLSEQDHDRLVAARKRYANSTGTTRGVPGERTPWDLILEGQREITAVLYELRDALRDDRRRTDD